MHPQRTEKVLLPLLEHVRAQKTSEELRAISKAAHITSETFLKARKLMHVGMTERELVVKITRIMRGSGAHALAFPVIVAFGENTAHVHHVPARRALKKNEIVMLDFGAAVKGYCSDMTRTFFFGKATQKFIRWHERVREAQERAIAKVRDGVRASVIDRAARDYLARFAPKKNFPHSTGHGVGTVIHEWPRIGPKSTDILRKGMVITVEPGVYFKGWGGVRIEDAFLVTGKGCELLTRSKSIQMVQYSPQAMDI